MLSKTNSVLACALAFDQRAATLAGLAPMAQGFRAASTLGVRSCPVAVSQGQTQAMTALKTLRILIMVQPSVAWTQAAKLLNYVTQQTHFGPTAAGSSASEGT